MFPQLPTLSNSSQPKRQLQMIVAPSGNGCGFTPDNGWGIDFSGIGFNGSGFNFGGGGSPLISINPGGGSGSTNGPDLGGGLPCLFNCGSSGSTVPISTLFPGSITGAVGSALSSVLGLPAINWGRIAAFLLGLLLIAGGLYLIKPVQEVVNRTVKETVRSGAEVAAT